MLERELKHNRNHSFKEHQDPPLNISVKTTMTTLLKNTHILYLDTETTGFGKKDRVCELSMIICIGTQVCTSFHSLIDPGVAMGEKAQEIHGISDEDLKFAPTMQEIEPAVLSFMNLAPICAHNLPFDARMLSRSLTLPAQPAFCSLELARAELNLRKNRVMDLANYAEVEYDPDEVHGAYEDTRLLHSSVVSAFGELLFEDVCGPKTKTFNLFATKALSGGKGVSP